ncbi:unnamed protein product, partial [Merluccius merluccius]
EVLVEAGLYSWGDNRFSPRPLAMCPSPLHPPGHLRPIGSSPVPHPPSGLDA